MALRVGKSSKPFRWLLAATLFVAAGPVTTMAAPSAPVGAASQGAVNLPDWGGIWVPDQADQRAQERGNPAPWKPQIAARIEQMFKDAVAGEPFLVFYGCFPHGMPSWMLVSHNAMEILFTPGRVTMLGEVDGNRMRRIYTDGRKHPEDPDLTFHGHSIGHWEGDTLVVDTVGVAPQAAIAITESVGVPNDGGMHIVERIRLRDADILEDQLVIDAPKVFTKPWSTTRLFKRLRGAQYDIVEGQCVQGDYEEAVDKDGHAIFVPLPAKVNGGVVPVKP